MKNVLRVKNIARALKLRKTLKPEEGSKTSPRTEVKQVPVQKTIADVRVSIYIVEELDTITSIAQKFNMSIVDLLFANQLYNDQSLYIGQALYVYNNDTTASTTDEVDEKPPAQGRTLFPVADEVALSTLSPYKLLLSSLRVNRDYSLCKESQAAVPTNTQRTPNSSSLNLLSHTSMLDEFRENVVYAYKGRPYAGVLSGALKQIVFDANWDEPIIENGLLDYQIVINTRSVMVCHIFDDTKEEHIDNGDTPEEPELQFGDIEEVHKGATGGTIFSYLQITVTEAGADPQIFRFKIETAKAHFLYKKIMAWIGKPVNPLSASLSASSYFTQSTPISTPSISAQSSARTSPITLPKVSSGFVSYAKESSGSNLETYFSPPLPARLLAQHQPEQSVLKEPILYLTKSGQVAGVLTVTSSMVVFEPELGHPMVVSHGLIANQINFFMADVYECLLEEGDNSKSSIQVFLRDGNNQKSVTFEGETDKVTQVSNRIRQQMAGRPKATDAFRSKPISMPSSPTHMISPVSSSPPMSLPSSPSSFISSLRTSAITRGFGVLEKLSSRSSSGEATPVEPTEHDDIEESSPALQSALIKTLESFVPQLHGESQFLTMEWIQFLRRYVSSHDAYLDWQLLYSTEKHGISMHTMYSRVRDKGSMFIVVEDSKGYIFGGYASEYFRPCQRYYGTGESFLFRLRPKLDVYPWPNTNGFFIFSTERFLSMGGGESGKYGLYLDAEFAHGTSAFCDTFHNEPLASSEFFDCSIMEIWGFVQ